MLHNLTGWHALIVLAIVLLVFGSTKLPSLARGVGQSLRILKDEVREEPSSPVRETTLDTTAPSAAGDAKTPAPYRPAS